ncbi:hypothetical protein B0J17DRAFT_658269 [Rhizoctonia solani]|nr:hypothetical protein B0J17DRAFT_658269 [Rhizoctonia solani]
MQSDLRDLTRAARLDWEKSWSKQDIDRQNTLIHAAEERRPQLKDFENHWATEFLLKDSFDNLLAYQRQQLKRSGGVDDDETPEERALRAKSHKAAAHCAAKRAIKRRKEECEEGKASIGSTMEDSPFNDGETEPEDLTEQQRQRIEREEIGVAVLPPKVPAKMRSKIDRIQVPSSVVETRTPLTSTSKASTSKSGGVSASKPRPVISMPHGRWIKAGRGGARVTHLACQGTVADYDEDGDAVSISSGQTSSGDEE